MTADCCRGRGGPIADHFDAARAESDLKRYLRKGPNPTTRRLRDHIVRAGVGATVLDVGAGIGAASFELLAAGAGTAVAVDLSPAYLAAARREAERRGVADRLRGVEGDFALPETAVPAADTVVLDRVVCCYPDCDALLSRALRQSRRLLALSYPRDRWYVRLVSAFENFRRALNRDPFRTFIHPETTIDGLITATGFRLLGRSGTVAWSVVLYERGPSGGPVS